MQAASAKQEVEFNVRNGVLNLLIAMAISTCQITTVETLTKKTKVHGATQLIVTSAGNFVIFLFVKV